MFLLLFSILTSLHAFAADTKPFDVKLEPITSIGGRPCCSLAAPDAYGKLAERVMKYEYVGIDKLGTYSYANHLKKEHLGILYSCHGGFIDLAHFRHIHDWTVYLFQEIVNLDPSKLEMELPYEGGKRKIIFAPEVLKASTYEKILIAAKISYDLSVWHEILTWYVPSTFIIKEKVSSFSPEDLYSNLLGAMTAVDDLNHFFDDEMKTARITDFESYTNKAMTKVLTDLEALDVEKSIQAFDLIDQVWWSSHYHLPRAKGTLKRSPKSYGYLEPHEAPQADKVLGCKPFDLKGLYVPALLESEYYEIEIKKDDRITASSKEIVTTKDFEAMTEKIKSEMVEKLGSDVFTF